MMAWHTIGRLGRWLRTFIPAAILIAGGVTSVFGAVQDFRHQQQQYPRVNEAYADKSPTLRDVLGKAGLSFPAREIFIRVFKVERVLEIWARCRTSDSFRLVKAYPICALSGRPGPKRQQGDGQIPEGFYWIDAFNPQSSFHLSLGVSYPNASDRILGVKGKLGGNICIHGNCVTIGCIPLTDEGIKEVYVLAVEARTAGQSRIPVHIFPSKFDSPEYEALRKAADSRLIAFWDNLKPGYEYFERHHRIPVTRVLPDGRYHCGN